MEIKSTFTNRLGQTLQIIYREGNPLENLEGKILQGVHGYCFCGDKLVVVYAEEKKYWTLPGGGIEPGESYEEALVRMVRSFQFSRQVLGSEELGVPTCQSTGSIS